MIIAMVNVFWCHLGNVMDVGDSYIAWITQYKYARPPWLAKIFNGFWKTVDMSIGNVPRQQTL